MNNNVFVASNVSLGQQVKLARVVLGLRQIDVASRARVGIQEVTRLEKDSYVSATRRQRILSVLGLDESKELQAVEA